jgi:hypothetical protein
MRGVVLLLIVSVMLFAEIGNIGAFSGSVMLERNGSRLHVTPGMVLEKGDVILTEKASKVQLIMKDNTIITLGQNSDFIINDFLLSDTKKSTIDMKLNRGFFRTLSGKIGKIAPERFKLHTRSATIGIRGTDFAAFVSKEVERIGCFSGAIEVVAKDARFVFEFGKMVELIHGKWHMRDLDIERFESILATGANEVIAGSQKNLLSQSDLAQQERLSNPILTAVPGYELPEQTPPPFVP